jgi:hypothetical protein
MQYYGFTRLYLSNAEGALDRDHLCFTHPNLDVHNPAAVAKIVKLKCKSRSWQLRLTSRAQP